MQPTQLQKLFDDLSAALVLYARQWCDMPDDAVQEAFIDLAKVAAVPNCAKAWLYITTRRKAQNLARAEQRRRNHHRQAGEAQGTREDCQTWFDTSSSSGVVAEDVARGLDLLDGDERELVVARIWGEMSFEQLAELLDCSVSSAHRRYSAALQRLKSILLAEENSDLEAAVEAGFAPNPTRRGSDLQHTKPQNIAPQAADQAKCRANSVAKLDTRTRLADGDVS